MNASTSHLTQARKSATGLAHGAFMGDRVGSSVTTHKREFGPGKSIQGHNMGNLEDDGRITDTELMEESLPDLKATPVRQNLKKRKVVGTDKAEQSTPGDESVQPNTNAMKSKSKGPPAAVAKMSKHLKAPSA